MSGLTKTKIEKQYVVYLDKDRTYETGMSYWVCFDSQKNMNWICNGYTLEEIKSKLELRSSDKE